MRAVDRISLHKLEVLVLVVELDGVSRAAERLMVSQPVVSAHLRSLEETLACTLFEQRAGRRVLTESGRAVHDWAKATLRATRGFERQLSRQRPRPGSIRLAASMSLGSYRVARVISRWLVDHPGLEVEQQVADLDRAVAAMQGATIDFAIVLGDGADRGLIAEEIGREPLVLLAAPDALDDRRSVTLVQLAATKLLQGHRGDGGDAAIDRALSEVGIAPSILMELGHPEAVKSILLRGVAAAFLPRSAAEAEIARGELVVIAVKGVAVDLPVQVLYGTGRTLSPLERELVEALREDYQGAAEADGDRVVGWSR